MLSQITRQSARLIQRRAFSQCQPRLNLIADLYIKEVKSFKPITFSAKDAEGNVKPFAIPVAPKTPVVEGSSADALSEYDALNVETVGVSSTEEATAEADDWFVVEEIHDEHH